MSKRSSMLASAIREIIAPILRECPRECGIVTITEVEMSPDGSYATVLISALQKPELALKFFAKESRNLQHRIGAVGTYRTPKLRFEIDPRSARGSRIDQLLDEEQKEDKKD